MWTQYARHTHYRPQRSCGQGFVFTRVCDSVNRVGVCLSTCWDTTPLPLGADTLPPAADSGIRSMSAMYACRHRTGMHSCFTLKRSVIQFSIVSMVTGWIMDRISLSPFCLLFIDTMLNSKGPNIGDGLNFVICEQTFTFCISNNVHNGLNAYKNKLSKFSWN